MQQLSVIIHFINIWNRKEKAFAIDFNQNDIKWLSKEDFFPASPMMDISFFINYYVLALKHYSMDLHAC